MKINKRQCAEIFGVAEETLTQWAKQGCPIEVQRKGTQGNVYDTTKVFKWRLEKAEHGDSAHDLTAERAALARAQREKIELELSETRGELVRVDAVLGAWAQHISTVKTALLGLPAKLAGQIAGPGRRAQVEATLRAEVRQILTELSASSGLPRKSTARQHPAGEQTGE